MGKSKSLRGLSIFLFLGILFGLSSLGNGQDCWEAYDEVPGPAAPPPRMIMATEWTTDTGGELDVYMGNQYSTCGTSAPDNSIDFTISITEAITAATVLFTMSTYDVDYSASPTPEIDKVYINGHYLGNLTGSSDAWSINTFSVPRSYLTAPGNNNVRVAIDTLNTPNQRSQWCVTVDYGTISLSGATASGVSIGNCDDYGEDTDANGKYDTLVIDIGVTADSGGSFNMNGALYDAAGNLIGWAQTTQSLSSGFNTMTLEFDGEDINCHLANGPYTLRNVTVYNTSDTSIRAFQSQLCSTAAYTYTQFDVCTTSCPVIISTSPVDGATSVSTSTTVSATFNMAMDSSTLTNANYFLNEGSLQTPRNGTVAYNSSTKTATFTPSSALNPDTFYTATITTSVKSDRGNALCFTKTWSFTTGTGGTGTCGDCIHPVSLTLSKNCGAIGESVTVTATAEESGVQFRFFVEFYDYCAGEQPRWDMIQNWSSNNSVTYTPSEEGRGIFFVHTAKNTNDSCVGMGALSYLVCSGSGGGTASLKVTVVDATTAAALSGAALTLDGQSGSTNASGVYTFSNLAASTFTLTTSKSGYSTNTQSVTLSAGENKVITVALSPQLAAGEVRIVLTWGQTPSDLDSHLTGPGSTGSRFHVYYSNRNPSGAGANLDVDDTSSYGPETVTITQRYTGTYKYYIHDYTNRNATSSSAMGQSGAKVEVYSGSGLVASYNVPSRAGTLWYVFSMNGSTAAITTQNQMSYESSPTGPSIQSLGAEVNLFQNLPEK